MTSRCDVTHSIETSPFNVALFARRHVVTSRVTSQRCVTFFQSPSTFPAKTDFETLKAIVSGYLLLISILTSFKLYLIVKNQLSAGTPAKA